MATLTLKGRKALPSKDFAGAGRSYPVEDKKHAKAALALLHNAPKSEQPKIRAKAEAKLHPQSHSAFLKLGQ